MNQQSHQDFATRFIHARKEVMPALSQALSVPQGVLEQAMRYEKVSYPQTGPRSHYFTLHTLESGAQRPVDFTDTYLTFGIDCSTMSEINAMLQALKTLSSHLSIVFDIECNTANLNLVVKIPTQALAEENFLDNLKGMRSDTAKSAKLSQAWDQSAEEIRSVINREAIGEARLRCPIVFACGKADDMASHHATHLLN